MKKSITIIGVNYYPEDTAIGLYTSQLAEYYQRNNIDVNVITGFPYYPKWKINENYVKKNKYLKEDINGVTVYRYKQYVPKNPTFLKRIIHLLDFTFGSVINVFKIKKTDVVLCIVPFTSVIFLGYIMSFLRKSKLWIHIQDFEFDAVLDSNIINGDNKSIFFKLLFYVEKKLFSSANLLSTISNAMLLKLSEKVETNKSKILLPNWVDTDFINPEKYTTHRYLKSKTFKILYSGNIGEKQDWDFFIQFIDTLKQYTGIEVIVVGDGGKKEWLQKNIRNLNNIKLYSPVPYNELSNLLCSADLHILFQKKEVIDTVMPSKILAMMASKRPLLITGNLKSEVSKVIYNSKSGEFFNTERMNEIIKYILKLRDNKSLSDKYGFNGRSYVIDNFSKTEVLKQFKNSFTKI